VSSNQHKLATEAQQTPSDLAWRVMGLVNLYRLLIAAGLFVASRFVVAREALHIELPAVMALVCAIYFFVGIGLIALRRLPITNLRILTLTHAAVDSVAVALIVWASGGIASGQGILLLLPVAAMAILARHRDAFFMAAMAAVCILLQQFAFNVAEVGAGSRYDAGGFISAGLLGAVIFVTALLLRPLANRLQDSEALVRKQELDLANLAQLSQYIVQHLRESILVVDEQDRIRLINEPAASVLNKEFALPDALLGECSPRLLFLLSSWRAHRRGNDVGTLTSADGSRVIQPHFAELGTTQPGPVLVFLEDTSLVAEKIQQTKLAALGRLSASIAHEIRTPVAAMSHAGQLLGESADISADDQRLTQIIHNNAERVSRIIDNVLEMSRRNASHPERYELSSWLRAFRDEFCATMQIPADALPIVPIGGVDMLDIHADRTQMHQVLWNLCENARTHGSGSGGPSPQLRYGRISATERPFVEVTDTGQGVPAANVERLFEPFFTTAVRGTGLGLFLSRELAQANGATLLFESRPEGGSIFRLVFPDPDRWME
jgi:two-component system, NtrC family, sensor histidine kinase PilS